METSCSLRDWTFNILAILIVVGFFFIVYVVVTGKMTSSDPNLLVMIGSVIGYASAKADQVVSYYFGSSKSSADKDATIAGMKTAPANATTTTTVSPTPSVVNVNTDTTQTGENK